MIEKTEKSEELLKMLSALPPDFSKIEKALSENQYTVNDISRAGYDFASNCWADCLDNSNEQEESYSEAKFIPNLNSSFMLPVFELLLKYGLDPNAICDGESLMSAVAYVFNEYTAADTLALLLKHGGNPKIFDSEESLLDKIDFDVVFGSYEQYNRAVYDSWVHCWFVLLGYSENESHGEPLVTVFEDQPCEFGKFEISDLINHRNYTFGISNVPERGEKWSLHIFDKRTHFEVARL